MNRIAHRMNRIPSGMSIHTPGLGTTLTCERVAKEGHP